MNWAQIRLWGGENYYWISGIYKVVCYGGHFHAYWITPVQSNWGDATEQPPNTEQGYPSRFWPSLEAAQESCERHAEQWKPSAKTVKRAAEILAQLIEDHEEVTA